jgi:hypothetical protein
MPIGMSRDELAQRWNKTLQELNCKFAAIQAPPGLDPKILEANPSVIRVPDSPPNYSLYSAYVDLAAAAIDLIGANNDRISEQLKMAGVITGA